MFPYAVDVTLKALYSLVATAGLLGNGGIIYIFITKKIKLNSFKVLLLNLAIADALAAASIWPYIYIDLPYLREMPNSNFMCSLTLGIVIYWLASAASIFSLTLMSTNRYLMICRPHAARYFSKRVASILLLCLVWPTAIIFSAPNTFAFTYLPKYALCVRDWPKGFNGTIFGIFTFILGLIFPVSVITFTFFATRRYFWSKRYGSVSRSSQSVRRNRTAAMVMALLIAAFFVCWSPFFAYWILSKVVPSVFSTGIPAHYKATRALRVVILVSLINTVTNPIIYGLRGDAEFKSSFRKLKQLVCCCKQSESNAERIEKSMRQTSSV